MKCYYCKKTMKQVALDLWTCLKCSSSKGVMVLIKNQGLATFDCIIDFVIDKKSYRLYTALFIDKNHNDTYYVDNHNMYLYNFPNIENADEICIPKSINITPKNILKRIKTYLLFQ